MDETTCSCCKQEDNSRRHLRSIFPLFQFRNSAIVSTVTKCSEGQHKRTPERAARDGTGVRSRSPRSGSLVGHLLETISASTGSMKSVAETHWSSLDYLRSSAGGYGTVCTAGCAGIVCVITRNSFPVEQLSREMELVNSQCRSHLPDVCSDPKSQPGLLPSWMYQSYR